MAHEVHTTNAIVLASADVQDADKLFWIFTEDFGLIFASAKSVREETSKLRYALQDLTQTKVSLVKGRGMWRITGAEAPIEALNLDIDSKVIFGKVSTLVRRVVPVDQKNTDIYTILVDVYTALHNGIAISRVEEIAVVRILFNLGYVSPSSNLETILQGNDFNIEYDKKTLIDVINTGLVESQL